MQMILLIIVMIMICGVTSAQINRHIDYDSLKNNPPEYGHPWDRYFFGSFDFETLPGPLTPTRVNFTLEAAKDDVPEKDDKDWIVQVLYPRHAVKLLGDSLFLWPKPHHIGDIYTGILEFMPLISGRFDVSLVRKGTRGAVAFRYCLDEDGNLLNLNRVKSRDIECDVHPVNYFYMDSIVYKYIARNVESELFNYHMVITPLPKIGDTSTITIYLNAAQDIPNGCDIRINGHCFEVIQNLQAIDYAIYEGQQVQLSFKFIPLPIEVGHWLSVTLSTESKKLYKKKEEHHIPLNLLFNDNGSLRYFSNIRSFNQLSKDRLPKGFFPKEDGEKYITRIWINRDK